VTPRARVIGLGQALAGDDGVGLAVLEWLGAAGVPDGVELVSACDESALLALLETPAPVVLVDAILGGRPGEVVELGPEDLATERSGPVSTHGLGVARTIALARVLGAAHPASVRLVGVTVARPGAGAGLSAPGAAAVPYAAARVRALVAPREP
jgi:hydrogenase maturation protease